MDSCPKCSPGAMCDYHVDRTVETLKGVARSRGMAWAQSCAERLGDDDRPWPPFEGRCAELALAKVNDLGRDPRANELLARELWSDAARWWSRRPR